MKMSGIFENDKTRGIQKGLLVKTMRGVTAIKA